MAIISFLSPMPEAAPTNAEVESVTPPAFVKPAEQVDVKGYSIILTGNPLFDQILADKGNNASKAAAEFVKRGKLELSSGPKTEKGKKLNDLVNEASRLMQIVIAQQNGPGKDRGTH
jgi:hypothetical protein